MQPSRSGATASNKRFKLTRLGWSWGVAWSAAYSRGDTVIGGDGSRVLASQLKRGVGRTIGGWMQKLMPGLVVGTITLLVPQVLWPCSCAQWVFLNERRGVQHLLDTSTLVMLAAVKNVESLPLQEGEGPGNVPGQRASLVPEKVWKGSPLSEYSAIHPPGPMNCRRSFRVGERLLIFSSGGEIPTLLCAPVFPAEESATKIKWLDKLSRRKPKR